MSSQEIHVRFSADLLTVLDEAAKSRHQTRSQFIRESIVLRLNSQIITKPPDPGELLKELMEQG